MNIHTNKSLVNTECQDDIIRPAYEERLSFANIMLTVNKILGVEDAHETLPESEYLSSPQIDNVILIFLDNFAWYLLEKYIDEYAFLDDYNHQISKLTSQFPATTSAHATSVYTGLPVYEHGIYEWHMYHDEIDEIISPFLLNRPTDTRPETLLDDYAIDQILPQSNVFERIEAYGLSTQAIVPNILAPSAFNHYYKGSNDPIGYATLSEGFTKLKEVVANSTKGFTYFYYEGIDTISHKYRIDSEYTYAELKSTLWHLQNFLSSIKNNPKTLVLVCADHGQTAVYDTQTVYLDDLFPDIKINQIAKYPGQNNPLGTPRDFFLRLDAKDDIKAIIDRLKDKLGEQYHVLSYQDMQNLGLFRESEIFKRRLGHVAIIGKEGHCAYINSKQHKITKKSLHGGLSSKEMYIPLISVLFS